MFYFNKVLTVQITPWRHGLVLNIRLCRRRRHISALLPRFRDPLTLCVCPLLCSPLLSRHSLTRVQFLYLIHFRIIFSINKGIVAAHYSNHKLSSKKKKVKSFSYDLLKYAIQVVINVRLIDV